MNPGSINLINTEFAASPLVALLPGAESLTHLGLLPSRGRQYMMKRHGEEARVITATVIRRDEAPIWEGTKDLIAGAMTLAAARVRGKHTFHLLSFHAQRELESFSAAELAEMTVRSALKLNPGEDTFLRYSSACGILKRVTDDPWGKITLSTDVELIPDEPNALYRFMARILRSTASMAGRVMVIIDDISAAPMFNPRCPEQQAALKKLEATARKIPPENPRECWIEGARIIPLDNLETGERS